MVLIVYYCSNTIHNHLFTQVMLLLWRRYSMLVMVVLVAFAILYADGITIYIDNKNN